MCSNKDVNTVDPHLTSLDRTLWNVIRCGTEPNHEKSRENIFTTRIKIRIEVPQLLCLISRHTYVRRYSIHSYMYPG